MRATALYLARRHQALESQAARSTGDDSDEGRPVTRHSRVHSGSSATHPHVHSFCGLDR